MIFWGLEFLWFFLFFSFFSLCWFGSGFSRIYDCHQCRRPQRVVILRPVNNPSGVSAMEGGYYVPASAFEECFPGADAAARQFNRDNAAASATTANVTPPAGPSTTPAAPAPPTYTP